MAFENFNWDSIINSMVTAAPAIVTGGINAYRSNDANARAAQIAGNTAGVNRQVIADANARGTAVLQPQLDRGAPAADYLRTVMARNPYEMTPQQDIELNDRALQANRSLPTAFRGSGRATSAVLNDVTNRGRAGMIQQNMARGDQAAGTLNAGGNQAAAGIANINVGGGRDIANINTGASDVAANAITKSATNDNAVLGNIAAYFANSQKEQDHESRYGKAKVSLSGA